MLWLYCPSKNKQEDENILFITIFCIIYISNC